MPPSDPALETVCGTARRPQRFAGGRRDGSMSIRAFEDSATQRPVIGRLISPLTSGGVTSSVAPAQLARSCQQSSADGPTRSAWRHCRVVIELTSSSISTHGPAPVRPYRRRRTVARQVPARTDKSIRTTHISRHTRGAEHEPLIITLDRTAIASHTATRWVG